MFQLETQRATASETLDFELDCFFEGDELPELEVSPSGDQCWHRDIERLDQLIGRYLLLALDPEQDFDRALKEAHLTLELIGMQVTLLESYLGDSQ